MQRPRSHSESPLPPQLEERMKWYALAAAGVGILAAGQPAEAEIVYTPTNQQIAPNTTLKIDLNNDGIADFGVKDTLSHTFFSTFARMSAVPLATGNKVWGHTVSRRSYASALLSDELVGPKGQFLPATGLMADVSFLGGKRPFASVSCTAPWANVKARYLGLKFIITGQVHFGWARLDVACSADFSFEVAGTLTGYAYETIANRPILAGDEGGTGDDDTRPGNQIEPRSAALAPASLGRLAQGASGLAAWRGKQ